MIEEGWKNTFSRQFGSNSVDPCSMSLPDWCKLYEQLLSILQTKSLSIDGNGLCILGNALILIAEHNREYVSTTFM